MANLLRQSVAALNAGLKTIGGEAVTYRRASEAIENVVAVPASTRHDDYGGEWFQATGREQDFILWRADLVKAGQPWIPARGDEIDRLDENGIKRTYQVLPRLDDRCYRETDPTGQQLRVYTVETLRNAE